MKKWRNQAIVAVCLLAGLVSCKKDDTPPAVPKLTPSGSFAMEFDDFSTNKSVGLLSESWLYSSLNVSFFSTIVSTSMAVPTIAFNESFTHSPVYIGNQTWQWSYNVPVDGATYTAKLNGIVQRKGKAKWEMYIDKAGLNSFSGFLWFEGTTTDSTAATWTVYENPAAPSVLFDIEWESNAAYTQSTLNYTYRNTGSENVNSTIEFGKSPESTFDRYYNILLTGNNSTINIEWNSATKNGRVKSPDYFDNESWHCWDGNHRDAWCD